MSRAEAAKLKAELIQYRQELILKKISVAEKALYNEVLDRLINELELSDGKITDGGNNISLVQAVDKIFKSFQGNQYIDIIRQFTGDMNLITAQNSEYFRIIGEAKNRIPISEEKANSRLRNQLGITARGTISKNGYLDKLINDKTVLKSIKKTVYSGIAGRVDLKIMQDDLKLVIEGNENVNGSLTRYLNQNLMDTYQAHDRTTGSEFAVSIGLNAAIYSGGLIGTSRCFCDNHNGKVYTRDEMQEWAGMVGDDCGPIWSDKMGAYVPEINAGGINCRHSIDWISNSEAIRRRPELRYAL